jgi:hypothetical protein
MKTKHYALMSEGKHDYDITVIKTLGVTSYEMRYSKGDQWNSHTKGEHILSATDHGNGILFTKKFKRDMDYDNFTVIRLLMEFINSIEGNIANEFKTYEQIN